MLVKSEPEFKFAAMRQLNHDGDVPSPAKQPMSAPAGGVHSAKQARSQLKHQALLQAGRRLLHTQDLGTLSVAQLTRDAGMAVGSFYSRFADKDAWFAELLRRTGDAVLADTQALLRAPRWQRAGDARKRDEQ